MKIEDYLDPTRRLIDGVLYDCWPHGPVLPVVRGGSEDDPNPDPEPKEFKAPSSQEELDRIINAAVGRTHSKYSDYEDLKAKATKLDELEAEGQSELEKERTGRETAEQERDRLAGENKRIKIEAALIGAAAGKAEDVAAAATLILAEPAKYAVTIDDAGQVTGADTAVKTLLEDKPFLASTGSGGAVDTGQGRNRGRGDGKKSGLAAGRERFEERHGTSK